MRRLLLLRHAKSDWPEGMADAERPLNERGREAAPLVGAFMAKQKLVPGLALISRARRTQETWDLVSKELGAPEAKFDERLYGAPADTILRVIRETPADIETLLVIGHNPGLERLAGSFAKSGDADAIRRIEKKYPTAGLAVIELPVNDWKDAAPPAGRLELFVTPKSLEI
jgi:phosphohistidine phosphatase